MTNLRLSLLFVCAWCCHLPQSFAAPAAARKPVFLYCLHYQAPGENRYPADGNYRDALDRLREQFEVRVSDARPTAKLLAGVDVVLLANPNDRAVRTNAPPRHLQPADVVFSKNAASG